MRELYERVLAERNQRGERSAVDVEDIVAVVERRGSEEHRAAILNRLLATAAGRRELDLIRAAVESTARPRTPRNASRFGVPVAIAATLVLAVASLMVVQSDADDPIRDGSSAAISLVSPGEELARGDTARFVWTRVAGAPTYHPEVIDESGLVVWAGSTTDTSIVLPGNVTLTPGTTYRWRVVAKTEAGDLLSTSRLLRVVPR